MPENQTYSAGPQTGDIRSDCQVVYTKSANPIEIVVKTKLEVMYSKSIRELAAKSLDSLSIKTGKLEIIDFGAIPFVMMAHIETAIKRAFPSLKTALLPDVKSHTLYTSTRDKFRRSRLYLPGNQPKLWLNAGIHKPDGVILDLEDSVPPNEKDSARHLVRNALRVLDFFGAERMVRINQGDMGFTDLDAIIPHNVNLVLVPKVESATYLKKVDAHIQSIQNKYGLTQSVYLMPILESARGILKALEIAEASTNTVALAIGLEDYTADLGVPRTNEGDESFFARSVVIHAARATGIQAIDTVFSDVNDETGLRESVLEAKALGFDGKGCIHPRQIRVVHDAFAPTQDEIDKALRIVEAAKMAESKGLGVVSLGSKMIDPPVVKRALHTINMAKATGQLK
jgi:citrate lyase subunit beta / citryl-CoA lyase